jgi:phage shock protein PspC (stress-responsive transcriptional regulator)
MNKVTTINLNGNAYQLEENGYEALRAYLDLAARSLQGNPDRDEIIADIEQAIADKFRAVLGPNKTVVVAKEVETIIAEMGPVQDASAPEGGQPAPAAAMGGTAEKGPAGEGPGTARRLYRIREGRMISGVCNGLAAYFNLDVSIVRVLFAILTITWGFGILLYLVMMFVIPAATTSAEKTAAFGAPSTAEEFIRRAKEGYYEGMKTLRDKTGNRWAHREWKRKFKRDMRDWGRDFKRSMHENAQEWRQNRDERWAGHHGFDITMAVVLPFLEIYRLCVVILAFYGAYSLLIHGAVFGLQAPAGIPNWVAALVFFILCNLFTIPAKILRHSYNCHRGHWGGHNGFVESIVWIGIVLLCIYWGSHHQPQVREVFGHLVRAAHQVLDSLNQAWNKK